MSKQTRRVFVVVIAAAVVGAGVLTYLRVAPGRSLPEPDSRQYEDVTRAFYRGLAALETGLLDEALAAFGRATEIVPAEPAGWANLGVARLRRADFDAAAAALDRAVALAPESSDIAEQRAAFEAARGRVDEAMKYYRTVVDLAPAHLRARFAMIELLDRGGDAASGAEAAARLEELLGLAPANLAVLVERARLAARRGDTMRLADTVSRLEARAGQWPEPATEQLRALRVAADAGDLAAATRTTAFLRNVLARVPEFRDSLLAVRVPAELIAEPLDRFVRLPPLSPSPAAADVGLSYAAEPLDDRPAVTAVVTPLDASQASTVLVADATTLRRAAGAGPWPLRGARMLVPLDWNHDFRMDVLAVGDSGPTLLLQDANGQFADASAAAGLVALRARVILGAWPADLDMDGDLDLIVGVAAAPPVILRNNGDGTTRDLGLFIGVTGVSGFAWADLDRDGDPDAALLDSAGTVHVVTNQQSGVFTPLTTFALDARALTAGDLDGNGTLDLLAFGRGVLTRLSVDAGTWAQATIATWDDLPAAATDVRLLIADLDNSGALDVVASADGRTAIWLTGADGGVTRLAAAVPAAVTAAADLTGDGLLDLVGTADGRAVRLVARGTQPYHWQVIRPRAQTAVGDQRINAFGVGGEIEVRSGLLMQKQVITGAPIHVGLGTHTAADVVRIVWPNGVMQAEFDLQGDRVVVAEQRLKGSCPWVFADNGEGMQFVTDFLWRSPLGLRINAQDTAGVTQTEDWIRIGGDQLVARDGAYAVRITAELWETHFFDHVSLLAVDHPVGSAMFIDERVTAAPPALAVQLMAPPTAVAGAWDDRGGEVTGLVASRDGRHAAGFERGRYQGITRAHAVEFDLGAAAPRTGPLWLVAQGWIYPTDSSINVAIAQGGHPAPRGLSLEVEHRPGEWRTLTSDLGFPAGKQKTILLDLSGRPEGARRFRLRTNLEIYWDALGWAPPLDLQPRTTRLSAARADLRYRGFSRTSEDRASHAPEVPHYDQLANTAPRWRDLVGYHTRFGDVRELLAQVDDRYVIMNAGDEMQLSFTALPPPAAGWTRDFVLVGDGWEKDGDFNTAFSKTVLPLPRHDMTEYDGGPADLERDPAYLRHPEDWQRYHTRFVAPERYLRGLAVPETGR